MKPAINPPDGLSASSSSSSSSPSSWLNCHDKTKIFWIIHIVNIFIINPAQGLSAPSSSSSSTLIGITTNHHDHDRHQHWPPLHHHHCCHHHSVDSAMPYFVHLKTKKFCKMSRKCKRILCSLGLLSELFSSFREIKAGNSGKAKLKEQIARK